MFATIVVVLPSEYAGGEVHFSHHNVNVTYDCSRESRETTFVGWYQELIPEVRPITDGYRLAVSFELIHTTNSVCPVISTNSAFIENVTQALLAWKGANGPLVQEKIVYLLENIYPAKKLRRTILEGVDAVIVSLLDRLGHEIGFTLGLATAVCHLSGPADDDRRRWCIDYQGADVDFMEIESRRTTIEGFVDLDGNMISDTLSIDEDRDDPETIPVDLSQDVEEEEHDEEEYDVMKSKVCHPSHILVYCWMYNELVSPKPNRINPLQRCRRLYCAGCPDMLTSEQGYNRTVLVIWPNEKTYKVAYAGQGLNYACANLDNADKPSESLTHLADFVLSRAAESSSRVVTSVCQAALRWNDFALWRRAVGLCFWDNGVAFLKSYDLLKALDIFGSRRVREVYVALALLSMIADKLFQDRTGTSVFPYQ